jgi:uncharacterized protein YdeI (YjbR/CyaY-like superfamily)
MTNNKMDTLAFSSKDAFEKWLAEHHDGSDGIWLKIAKKESGVPSVSYAEALDVALCFGWIDGQKGALDEKHWLQRFTPRKAKSKWSKINRDKAVALIEQGRMRPAGLAEVERAKTDGRWQAAYDGARTSSVPDDLVAALAANAAAAEFFETLDRQNRFAILYRIQDVKKLETRARRIEKYVAMLAEGKKLYP